MSRKSGQDLAEIQVAAARVVPVRICHMEVKEARPAGADALGHRTLLDVHVECVEQEADVLSPDILQQLQARLGGVQQRAFIAVDGLHGKADVDARGFCRDRS